MTSWLRRLRARVRYRHFDRDLAEELETHRVMKERELLSSGLAADEARGQARRDLGNVMLAREDARAVWIAPWLESVGQDIRLALRLVVRDPGLSIVACLTLALGIGVNAAIFSVVDAALFRPLPYKNADRLVDLLVTVQTRGGDDVQVEVTGRRIEELRGVNSVFEGVDAFSGPQPKALATGSDLSPLVGAFTPTFPGFLGVAPQLGRAFDRDDVLARDGIVISDAYWRQAFNRDPNVIGKTIAFSDQICVVVGVMPPTFRYFVGAQTDAWLPLAERDGDRLAARLRPGISLEQAQRDLRTALAGPGLTWRPRQVELHRADWNRSDRSTRTMLFSLLGAVGFVLVIACANVANLLLARTLTRQREIAVRSALGASRFRVARQFLIEGLLLAGLGGAVATVLAWGGIKAIPAIVPANLTHSLMGASLPELDVRVLAFGILAVTVSGILCGAMPALRASHSAATGGLLAGGQSIAGVSRGQRRVRHAFQALQVAMTLVLLAGAGLLLSSLLRLVSVPTGFVPEDLGYASLTFPRNAYTQPAQTTAFYNQLIARLATVPGFRAATVGPPPVSGYAGYQFHPEGSDDEREATAVPLELFPVRTDYFRVAGIPLREGRVFGPEDGPSAPPVAIISENAARRLWPGRSAIGQRFRWYPAVPPLTVVGVVPHIRTINLARAGGEVYVPAAQGGEVASLVFRTTGEPAPAIAAIRAEARSIDPTVTVGRIGMVDKLFAEFDPIGSSRFYALLLGLFAGVGLLTAAVGLYGLLSYSVSRRTHEIGVRIALGAGIARVRWLMIADAFVPVGAGMVVGLVAAGWLSRLIASQLFQVTPGDPATLVAIAMLFVVVSAVAVIAPVRRATRIEPAEALRTE